MHDDANCGVLLLHLGGSGRCLASVPLVQEHLLGAFILLIYLYLLKIKIICS
jgi:hypothetical protein